MEKLAIIMSGLPASGKSTLGRLIAGELEFNFLEKMIILNGYMMKYV